MEDYSQLEEKVILYLEGELSHQEVLEFEIEISKNESLRQLVEEYTLLLKGVDYWNTEILKTKIQSVNNDLNQSGFFETPQLGTVRNINQGNKRKYWAIAASILVIVTTIVFYLSTKNTEDRSWVANYNQPEKELSLSFLSKINEQGFIPGATGTDTLLMAIQLYAKSSYSESLEALKSLSLEIQNTNIAQYYIGLNLMGLAEYSRAEAIFYKLCEVQSFDLKLNACWSYGLSLVNQNSDQQKIISVFEQIANSNSTFSNMAKEILSHYQ